MFAYRSKWFVCALIFLFGAAWLSASDKDGKIPITTKSGAARSEFLQGRDLADRLLLQQAIQHLDKAIALDPDFASAELARANIAPTTKDFFEHLHKAVSLANQCSQGEKLLILANEAGANGEAGKQGQYLDQLAVDYPNDERVQFALCNYYFGRQDNALAVESCKKAAEIAPKYSPTYNTLGYAYRQLGDFTSAAKAFNKYIELIPRDPNPYDSYAELLLRMGRFDDSIAEYRKALSLDPHFLSSYFGIASDLLYQGKPDQAARELQAMAAHAEDDGQLRTALFGLTVVAADRGRLDNAIEEMGKEYAVAEKKGDLASMAADLQAKGNLFLQMKRYGLAADQFGRSVRMIEKSNLSPQIKDNSKLLYKFNLAAVALGKKDYASAKRNAEEFQQGVEASENPAQLKQAHELLGRIAFAQKNYDRAVAEFERANLQNPMNLYRLSQAYRAKGNREKADQYERKVIQFNSLLQLNYAFARAQLRNKSAGSE